MLVNCSTCGSLTHPGQPCEECGSPPSTEDSVRKDMTRDIIKEDGAVADDFDDNSHRWRGF